MVYFICISIARAGRARPERFSERFFPVDFMKQLLANINESVKSVLPISAIVFILSVSLSPLHSGVLVLFVFGTILLMLGMSLFSLGANMSMTPLGEGIGIRLHRSKKGFLPVAACFLLGVAITVAEPDLSVLAEQISSIPNLVLILAVGVGVGIFLVIAMLRAKKGWKLNRLLLVFYGAVLVIACFAPASFLPAAFDSGGVTTGPVTVPFIMALGAGIAAVGDDKNGEESFGLVALCSIGPILSVLLMSLFKEPQSAASVYQITEPLTTRDAFVIFQNALPETALDVLYAFLPILGVFVFSQFASKRFSGHELSRIFIGMLYTYGGLVLFLTGANAGFMPAGVLLGRGIASSGAREALVPVGFIMGFFVVAAEPAVHVLKKQVETVTNGAISSAAMGIGLSVGVGASVALSMTRILTGLSLFPFVLAGYAVSLIISFFVPPIFTGIAFDSGGVASGPMTSAFMLPFAVGAAEAAGADILTQAFGLVAMVALAPLITIQCMGFYGNIRRRMAMRRAADGMRELPDVILYYDRPAGHEEADA